MKIKNFPKLDALRKMREAQFDKEQKKTDAKSEEDGKRKRGRPRKAD